MDNSGSVSSEILVVVSVSEISNSSSGSKDSMTSLLSPMLSVVVSESGDTIRVVVISLAGSAVSVGIFLPKESSSSLMATVVSSILSPFSLSISVLVSPILFWDSVVSSLIMVNPEPSIKISSSIGLVTISSSLSPVCSVSVSLFFSLLSFTSIVTVSSTISSIPVVCSNSSLAIFVTVSTSLLGSSFSSFRIANSSSAFSPFMLALSVTVSSTISSISSSLEGVVSSPLLSMLRFDSVTSFPSSSLHSSEHSTNSISFPRQAPPFFSGMTTDLCLSFFPEPQEVEQEVQSDQGDHKQFVGRSISLTSGTWVVASSSASISSLGVS